MDWAWIPDITLKLKNIINKKYSVWPNISRYKTKSIELVVLRLNMETKNVVSIFAGHDANITFFNAKNNSYHIIELERLTGKRYFRLHVDNDKKEIKRLLIESQNIAEDFWGIENNYDTLLINSDGWIKPKRILKQVFNYKKIQTVTTHHYCHASAAFYQSPYDEAIIFSYDGGGDDGFFNIYKGDRTGIKLIDQIESDFGGVT